jgi:hypothetical protein
MRELTLTYTEVDGTEPTLHNITSIAIDELGSVSFVQRTGGPWPDAQSIMNINAVQSIALSESE